MAHTKSARKRARQNEVRRLRNRRRKRAVKQTVRAFQEALTAGQTERAAELLREAHKRLDKTAAKGTIHKKAAARKKSRLARRLAAATAAK